MAPSSSCHDRKFALMLSLGGALNGKVNFSLEQGHFRRQHEKLGQIRCAVSLRVDRNFIQMGWPESTCGLVYL